MTTYNALKKIHSSSYALEALSQPPSPTDIFIDSIHTNTGFSLSRNPLLHSSVEHSSHSLVHRPRAQPYLVSVPPPLDISLPSPPLLLFNARTQSCFFPARQSPSSLARSSCRAASTPHTCSLWRWPPRYYQPSSPGRALCSP